MNAKLGKLPGRQTSNNLTPLLYLQEAALDD